MYRLFYYPDRIKYDTPERLGLAFESVYFKSADGTVLSGWFIPALGVKTPLEAKGTVVHLHGNAQNMSAHFCLVDWLPVQGYNLFLFDYRGYGQSHGTPDPKGIFEDSIAALNYLRARADIAADRLYVFGQSLGGMLAIAAAAASPTGIRAVLAEAPIHSYTAFADDKMPAAELIVEDTYCATSFMQKLASIPLLLIHSKTDKVVPYSHSLRLQSEASGPVSLLALERGEHNAAMTEAFGEANRHALLEFFASAA